GSRWLVNSAFGQPVASIGNPSSFFCDQATGYQDWLTQFFPENVYLDPARALTDWGMQSDPGGNGIPNFVEFALGLSPFTQSRGPFIVMQKGFALGTNRIFV